MVFQRDFLSRDFNASSESCLFFNKWFNDAVSFMTSKHLKLTESDHFYYKRSTNKRLTLSFPISLLLPLKTSDNLWFSDVFSRIKITESDHFYCKRSANKRLTLSFPISLLLHLKTSDSLWFSDVFSGIKKELCNYATLKQLCNTF